MVTVSGSTHPEIHLRMESGLVTSSAVSSDFSMNSQRCRPGPDCVLVVGPVRIAQLHALAGDGFHAVGKPHVDNQPGFIESQILHSRAKRASDQATPAVATHGKLRRDRLDAIGRFDPGRHAVRVLFDSSHFATRIDRHGPAERRAWRVPLPRTTAGETCSSIDTGSEPARSGNAPGRISRSLLTNS